jgi:hypothetical protein
VGGQTLEQYLEQRRGAVRFRERERRRALTPEALGALAAGAPSGGRG